MAPPRRRTPLKRKSAPKPPKPISTTSAVQRAKIAAAPFCVICGIEQSEWVVIDPAHLVKRSAGGCDDPLCVLGLCRRADGSGCHRSFDVGDLGLLPVLVDKWPAYMPEVQHMLEHVTPVEMLERLASDRTQWSNPGREAA